MVYSQCVSILVSTVALFFITGYILEEETLESLESNTHRVLKSIENSGELINIQPIISTIEVKTLGSRSVIDTIIFDPWQNEDEVFKQLTSYKAIGWTKTNSGSSRTSPTMPEDLLH